MHRRAAAFSSFTDSARSVARLACAAIAVAAALRVAAPAGAQFGATMPPVHATAMAAASMWKPGLGTGTLLWALERSGARLATFSADITYERYREFEDERERRIGRLALEGEGTARRLGCLFSEFYDSRGAKKESKDHWVYADGWLGEADLRFKSFTKRRVIEPGASWDPLKLGEGPFPLPFGQAEAEVRARFVVEPATLPESSLVTSALAKAEAYGMRLTPKPNTPLAKDARYVEVFYTSAAPGGGTAAAIEQLIPRVVVFVKPSGDRSTIVVRNPRMNVPLSDDDRALLAMPNPDPNEWSVDIRDWESAGGTPAGPDGIAGEGEAGRR